jgi:hypothetical protein
MRAMPATRSNRDSRIDAYIARSAEFARPILAHLREVVHEGCPAVVETLKWSMPSFEHQGLLCGMGAFKRHCTFGFWKHGLVVGKVSGDDAMGQFGRITRISDLPPRRTLLAWVRKAAKLNEDGVMVPRPKRAVRKFSVPADLAAALKKNQAAASYFEGLSPSHRREYVEWITEAKREETRTRRLATTLEWLAAGKSRNWKYERR